MKKTVLVVAAHPDDEVLGCGGTIAKLAKGGHQVNVLILGEGVTSRYEKKDQKKINIELKKLSVHANNAVKVLGVKKLIMHDFPDNRFDSVELLELIRVVERIKNQIKPQIVFTHYELDLNIDHRLTYQAVLTAMRPLPGERVKEIYSFESLSSSEFNYPISFSPDTFFDIASTLDVKIKAMNEYKDELRSFPHTRSLEAIKLNAKLWGAKTGQKCVEAFKCVRRVI